MARVLMGRYRHLILEVATHEVKTVDRVRTAREEELNDLRGLLADGEHLERIRAGDLCCVIENDDLRIVGLQWVNRVTHQDRYLGRISRPTQTLAYINQTFVERGSQGQGYGRLLMLGTLGLCGELGIEKLRLSVEHRNSAMLRLCRSVGFVRVGSQYGIRIAGLTVRLNSA